MKETLILYLSLAVLCSVAHGLTPFETSSLEDTFKICNRNTATGATTCTTSGTFKLQCEPDCSACKESKVCTCSFNCKCSSSSGCSYTLISTTRGSPTPHIVQQNAYIPTTFTTGTTASCKKACNPIDTKVNTAFAHNSILPADALREPLEFVDTNFPGGRAGFAAFATLGAAVPPPLPMFPPIGLPQPLGLQPNAISAIPSPSALAGGGGAVPAAALTVRHMNKNLCGLLTIWILPTNSLK